MADMDTQDQINELQELFRDVDDVEKLHPCLRPWVQPENEMTKFPLKHPWVFHVIGPLLPHQCNAMFEHKSEKVREAWREKDWEFLLWLHERPYRMQLLEKLYFTGRITLDQMKPLLVRMWTDTEFPGRNQQEALSLFREAGWVTDDQDGFDALGGVLELYRGVNAGAYGTDPIVSHGCSWTLSRKVADFFANRFQKGKTFTIKVKKDDPAVLAYITGRSEEEIILDFGKLNKGYIALVEDFSE